ncbi:cobalamin B12-binding domain-containing protein [Paenibacillus antri]|uniref:Cobalamin B12-binding domain-containing protein n=1 Tax=Paenibacillus antri TaxID=2582848 RepID=A0A5R9G966_9BACL|nr:cobalamin B12-binding domain-containing protein [Paenibacillus antri]TLS49928.1 cobalamin B12-binding domain-containing protein [Paenibacillus antri]
MNKRLHTIKEVSLRTGLSTQLIRKWEERYGVVSPARFPNGYRGYTKEHVDTFLWLKSRVDAGVPIGLAVQEFQSTGLLAVPWGDVAEAGPQAAAPSTSGLRSEAYRRQFLSYFLQMDYRSSQQLFDQLMALHQVDYVLLQVLQPTLVELGEMWERGRASEFQEHFGSHFVRDRLLAMKNLYNASPIQPLVVTACAPYERHEIGVLYFGFYAMQQGFRNVYLGAAPSEKGILDCLRESAPRAFAFGVSTPHVFNDSLPFFRQLDEDISAGNRQTKVFVGGRAIEEDAVLSGTRNVYLLAGDAKETAAKIRAMLPT